MSRVLLTGLALLAFAANSILCRMALGEHSIDAVSFTAIRLLSGALVLAFIVVVRERRLGLRAINPLSAAMLFVYAICFSWAYLELPAGTGALILFAAVQLTMILTGVARGERPAAPAWLGIAVAFAGLVYLLSPGIRAPALSSALLMMVAGIAWGGYTLRGRGARRPLITTAGNFIATVPLVAAGYGFFASDSHITARGVTLALLSGTLASALGYVIWYRALPYLTATTAATVQLAVPVIAAFGGVVLLGETVSLRLLLASVVVLGGIYVTINARHRPGDGQSRAG